MSCILWIVIFPLPNTLQYITSIDDCLVADLIHIQIYYEVK